MTTERVPPQDVEVERSVLGAMMLEPEALDRGLELLSENEFYRENHRMIFSAMKELVEKSSPADLITIAAELDAVGNLQKIGGRSYLSSLMSSVVTAGNLDYHTDIIRQKSVLRSLIHAGSDIVSRAYNESQDVSELLDSIEQMIFNISEKRLTGDFSSLGEILPQTYDYLEEVRKNKRAVTGLATGYNDLDDITSGMHPSDYIVIAARPSIGKTALVLGIALNVAINEKKGVALFSLEMAKDQLVTRLMASKFHVDAHRLRTGTLSKADFKRIGNNLPALSSAPIYIDDSASLTVLEMRTKTRRLMRRVPLGLIVVDYLQLLNGSSKRQENRQQEISMISRQLKALGREMGVPVIALSQLSRQVESRDNKRPILADLRESGAIEQDADVVMFIYRPEMYGKKQIKIFGNTYPSDGIAQILIAKQRNGPVGDIFLRFKREWVTFENLSIENIEPFEDEEEAFVDREAYGGA
jgi:replicative DNA helicase